MHLLHCMDTASHLIAWLPFCVACDSSPHLLAQLMKPGVGWNVSCSEWHCVISRLACLPFFRDFNSKAWCYLTSLKMFIINAKKKNCISCVQVIKIFTVYYFFNMQQMPWTRPLANVGWHPYLCTKNVHIRTYILLRLYFHNPTNISYCQWMFYHMASHKPISVGNKPGYIN